MSNIVKFPKEGNFEAAEWSVPYGARNITLKRDAETNKLFAVWEDTSFSYSFEINELSIACKLKGHVRLSK